MKNVQEKIVKPFHILSKKHQHQAQETNAHKITSTTFVLLQINV